VATAQRWQYQAIAEPTTTDLPDKMGWAPQYPSLVYPKPKPRTSGIMVVETFGEVVFPDKYMPRMAEPVWKKPPRPWDFVVEPLEPSLFTVATPFGWNAATSTPIFKRRPSPDGGMFACLCLTDLDVPRVASWWVQASEPVWHKRTPLQGEYVRPIEPSLYVIPTIDSWYQKVNEPVVIRRLPVGAMRATVSILVVIENSIDPFCVTTHDRLDETQNFQDRPDAGCPPRARPEDSSGYRIRSSECENER
jgi:hypothetical protein